MAMKKVFCFPNPNGTTFIFKNAKVAVFKPAMGRSEAYISDPQQIAWMEEEIASGLTEFFVDPNRVEIDPDVDPLETVRAEAVAKYIAEQAALKDKTRPMGGTDRNAPLTGIATTAQVNEGASSSDSGASANVAAGAAGKVNAPAPGIKVSIPSPSPSPSSI